jgi:hypothetical protein
MERADNPATDARRMLEIYLRDHYGGSTAGVALARRCRQANEGTEWSDTLSELETEIAEDQDTLRSIMSGWGIAPSRIKSAVGAVGEAIGRLKSNGRLWGYSPLSRVIELEGLTAGVEAKRDLWRALRHLDGGDVVDAHRLDGLIERAGAQLERLHRAHDRAAAIAFARAPVRRPVAPA